MWKKNRPCYQAKKNPQERLLLLFQTMKVTVWRTSASPELLSATAWYSSSFGKFLKYGKGEQFWYYAFNIAMIASLRHETGESSFPRTKIKICASADLDVNAVKSRCVAPVRFNSDFFFLWVHAWVMLSPGQHWPAKLTESENQGFCQRINRFFCKFGASSFYLT